ncbi:hypothetical protein ACHAXN_011293 [Cyclotella atomus]
MYSSAANYGISDSIEQHQYSAFHPVSRRTSMKRSIRKISFNEDVRVRLICERSSEMTQDEKSQLYYSKNELTGFYQECKDICKGVIMNARSLSASDPSVSPAKNLSSILDSDYNLRGFEVQVCPMRKNNKAMVHKAVQMYHKQLNDLGSSLSPEQKEMILADAYSKLSYWSQMLALNIAQKDLPQEEDSKSSIRFAGPVPCSTNFLSKSIPTVVSPMTVQNKRSVDIGDDLQRKRCRISRAA